MNKRIWIGIFLFFYILPAFSQNETAISFLKWSIDPVSVGRGESGNAVFSGGPAFLFNPANINAIGKWDMFYARRPLKTFFEGFRNLNYFLAGGVYRFDEKNIAGVYVRRFSYTLSFPVLQDTPSDYNAFDLAVAAMYGRKLGDNWSAGLGFQFLRSDLGVADANGWAFDLGVNRVNLFPSLTFQVVGEVGPALQTFQTPDKTAGLNIGLALLNAGPHIAYIDPDQADPIPQRLRLGILYQVISSPLISLQGLFDFEKELVYWNGEEYDPFYKAWFTGWKGQPFKEAIYHFGGELKVVSIFSLRYGYRYEPFQDFFDKGISTIGFGIDLKYLSLHYGEWIDTENMSFIEQDSYVIGLRIGDIRL
jgi:hypothetical protein